MNISEAELFFKAWDSGVTEFHILSSGSTGKPKSIVLERQWMEWSAKQTALFLKPNSGERLFCCLPISRVGGLMMLVRARVWGLEIQITEAIANPLVGKVEADIISLTPYQVYHIASNPESRKYLERFREVLIGGTELPYSLELDLQTLTPQTKIRHSYGMSETYSHIALREINGENRSDWFQSFADVQIEQDQDASAIIKTPFSKEAIYTNDIISLNDKGLFKVIGRKDFVINSGGVKLQPEQIEKLIDITIKPKSRFMISSVHDEILGQKMVLVCEDKKEFIGLDMSFLKSINKYAVPKLIIEVDRFPLNEGGKTDRLQIRELIQEMNLEIL